MNININFNSINTNEKEAVDIKSKTAFIKELISESENLMLYAKTDEAKEATKKVYEEFKYSDPMSNDKLYYIEKDISDAYIIFADNIKNNINDGILAQAEALCLMIKERNNKCKLLK